MSPHIELRIGEALALRRRHLDVSSGRVAVAQAVAQVPGGPVIDTPKNDQRRELAVPAFVVQLLREHLTPHDLRATHASWVADSHGVLVAARRLGHANASVTTRHYVRAVDGGDAEVAQHLDASGTKVARRSGTQRARKPRKAEQ
ncbi:hypothetical protein RMN56_08505 [Micromonospora halotolerans]|uniref:Tyr recombinase domain-containing protein n=1 Tax=Micromonospora halotolerans TaxID=709879 RepID=A0ABZ0A1D0_9ACTN|nr:hypothetical protein [Micromonospora halotolerans]WNM41368.1 hypothetical protein RMN56_08505 [Micromonospora halotolerans]